MMMAKLFCLLISCLVLFQVISTEASIASLGSTWINSSPPLSLVNPILSRQRDDGLLFAFGFFCNNENCDTSFLIVFIGQSQSESSLSSYLVVLQVVWSANRNHPVRHNATLQLTIEGDFVLRDVDGSLAWSTNTRGKGVKGLNLTENGNLVLFDGNGVAVWQWFDHPTDSLVPGQKLVLGQNLTASVSESNWTEGKYFASIMKDGFFAFIESNRPQAYTDIFLTRGSRQDVRYAQLLNGGLSLFVDSNESFLTRDIPRAQFMRMMPDGHLRVYEWADVWKVVIDLTDSYVGECNYPMVCGVNGICSNGQCSCPTPSSDLSIFFRQNSERHPDLGCSPITQLSCNASQYHRFVDLEDVTYFTFNSIIPDKNNLDINGIDVDRCKEACLRNCSCKAAIFKYFSNSSNGDCYLPSEIFSLMENEKDKTEYNSSAHIKVQILPSLVDPSGGRKKRTKFPEIMGSTVGGVFVLVLVIVVVIIRKRKNASQAEEDYLDHLPGMPSRLSYDELRIATDNFSTKLGQGGFGSVYKGVLKDGTNVAVKCLDGVGEITKSFLAEVQSIGSIHHVNLVRLVGFVAEKSHRLLVYEYMINGSLDRWIYHKSPSAILDFKSRKAIIQDVAKGLEYLHEDCRQKIIHLDIKPQNILLDENFNAKLSDFGLSKLIERDQSQVVTTMRGTPGYLAPEWLSAIITEKVDVYSFGIVVLEILCGRKIFEVSETEDARFLLSLFKMKAMEGALSDIVDKYSDDMQSHGEEAVEMMKIAAWCLHSDYGRRPSMSVVVKVLDGVMDVEKDLDYNSLNSQTYCHQKNEKIITEVTPRVASVLSGPR